MQGIKALPDKVWSGISLNNTEQRTTEMYLESSLNPTANELIIQAKALIKSLVKMEGEPFVAFLRSNDYSAPEVQEEMAGIGQAMHRDWKHGEKGVQVDPSTAHAGIMSLDEMNVHWYVPGSHTAPLRDFATVTASEVITRLLPTYTFALQNMLSMHAGGWYKKPRTVRKPPPPSHPRIFWYMNAAVPEYTGLEGRVTNLALRQAIPLKVLASGPSVGYPARSAGDELAGYYIGDEEGVSVGPPAPEAGTTTPALAQEVEGQVSPAAPALLAFRDKLNARAFEESAQARAEAQKVWTTSLQPLEGWRAVAVSNVLDTWTVKGRLRPVLRSLGFPQAGRKTINKAGLIALLTTWANSPEAGSAEGNARVMETINALLLPPLAGATRRTTPLPPHASPPSDPGGDSDGKGLGYAGLHPLPPTPQYPRRLRWGLKGRMQHRRPPKKGRRFMRSLCTRPQRTFQLTRWAISGSWGSSSSPSPRISLDPSRGAKLRTGTRKRAGWWVWRLIGTTSIANRITP